MKNNFENIKKLTLNTEGLVLLEGVFFIFSYNENVVRDIKAEGYVDVNTYCRIYLDVNKYDIKTIRKVDGTVGSIYKIEYSQDYIDYGLAGMAGNQY